MAYIGYNHKFAEFLIYWFEKFPAKSMVLEYAY